MARSPGKGRPNILVFMTDDHAHWAAGYAGCLDIRTPSLDYLASRGVRMTNAFTPCPACSPARASFFTGRLPSQHGIQDWLKEDLCPEVDWLEGETTLSELLKEDGYRTGLVGKWRLGRSQIPQAGFDFWVSHQSSESPHSGEQSLVEGEKPLTLSGHPSPFLTGKAIQFLRVRRKQPFFLFVSYMDPRAPFAGHPERLVSGYRSCAFEDIPSGKAPSGPGCVRYPAPIDGAARREALAQYYAAVTLVDEQVGVLIDELEGSGDLKNTLLIYTSDHGHMNGHHGLYTAGNATTPQNFLEESIRTPLLISWPGHIPEGVVCSSAVDHCDLFRTVLEAAGCPMDEAFVRERRYPGRSFLPLLQEPEKCRWRHDQFCEYGNARMIRTERYKLIRRYAPHAGVYPDELYDLEEDPRETRNRIEDPELSARLRDLDCRLDEHFSRYEQPEYSARDILSQPVCNPAEPWRVRK